MNIVYAIKCRKSGLYYSNNPVRGSWWGDLASAKFYKTEDGAQRVIDGKGQSSHIVVAIKKADPYIVPVQLTEMYSPQRVEPQADLVYCDGCGRAYPRGGTCHGPLCPEHADRIAATGENPPWPHGWGKNHSDYRD